MAKPPLSQDRLNTLLKLMDAFIKTIIAESPESQPVAAEVAKRAGRVFAKHNVPMDVIALSSAMLLLAALKTINEEKPTVIQ